MAQACICDVLGSNHRWVIGYTYEISIASSRQIAEILSRSGHDQIDYSLLSCYSTLYSSRC